MSMNFRSLQEQLRARLLAQINAGELTGIELARRTGFQQAHISNFLNRKRGLSLDAMDQILRSMRITLEELISLADSAAGRMPQTALPAHDFVAIPIVQEGNCTATQVPNRDPKNTIQIASAFVQRLRPQTHIPRPHWQRFIALRVSASEVHAMSPRLPREAIIVIDRHHNAVSDAADESMYVVRLGDRPIIRYIETVGSQYILRALNPLVPLLPLKAAGTADPLTAIVGRVCFVHALV